MLRRLSVEGTAARLLRELAMFVPDVCSRVAEEVRTQFNGLARIAIRHTCYWHWRLPVHRRRVSLVPL